MSPASLASAGEFFTPEQSGKYIRMHVSILFEILCPFRLLHTMDEEL